MVSGNLQIDFPDKVNDVGTYRRVLYISLNAFDSIENRSLALIYLSVSLGNIIDLLLGKTGVFTHDDGVDAIEHNRIVSHDDIGRNIAAYTCAAFDEDEFTYAAFLVHNGARRKDGACVDINITGYSDTVADNALSSNVCVVTDVGVAHDEAVATYYSTPLRVYASVDNHMLTDNCVVAYGTERRVSLPAEVLRIRSHNSTLIYLNILP